ncbi:MAG: AbrB/MazE/SpoVT family DNA-binding domain-containing protein [Patescibacteria group bacterium]
MKTMLKMWGNSLAVRIPKKIADQYRLEEGSILELKPMEKGVFLEKNKRRSRIDIEKMIEKITPETLHDLVDWGPPVGKEIW